MNNSETEKPFNGYLLERDGKFFLMSGGIEAELIWSATTTPDLSAGGSNEKVTVRGRQEGGQILNASLAGIAENAPDATSAGEKGGSFAAVIASITANKDRLKECPDVVRVQPGYRTEDGRLTDAPAIVVIVKNKISNTLAKIKSQIPGAIDGVPIEVRYENPLEALELSETQESELNNFFLTGEMPPVPEAAAPRLSYELWDENPLKEFTINNITCHISPDAGLEMLRQFLQETENQLTVAIYDFHSPAVFEVLSSSVQSITGEFSLIIDPDSSKPDETIEGTFKNDLSTLLDERFANWSWASTGGTNPLFLNSYHTKVAVRDSRSFWLSSGNWTPTSQPEVTLADNSRLYSKGNREWHVIVHDEPLAKLFEDYILRDIEQANARFSEVSDRRGTELILEAEAKPDLLVLESFFAEPEAAVVQPQPFRPRTFTSGKGIKVQPLLSPDNYVDKILELIDRAQNTLYLQYSYIRFPKESDKFQALIDKIVEKINAGVDVRVIVSTRSQKPDDTDKLIRKGFTVEHFRRQDRVHNKAILVDSRFTLVSSQNWSRDGILYNRDAGLIIDDKRVAKYYQEIFLFDWNNLARPQAVSESSPIVAPTDGKTPPGMVRIPWRTFFED